MSKISSKTVVKNSIIYTFGGLLTKCFSFFLLPLYTMYLTAEDYGITSLTSSFTATMGFVVALSLFSAVLRFYVDLKDDPKKLKRFYGTIVTFSLLSAVVWGALLTALKGPVTKYIFSGVDYYPVVFLCLISLVFNVQHTIYINILKSQQRAAYASILSLAFFLVTVGLNILFVVGFKMGAVGVLVAGLIANVLFFALFMIDMIRTKAIIFCLDFPLLKEALKYSIPIMPHNLSTQIAMLISKALIGGSASLASLGLYSVAAQFGNIADTVQGYVDSAYGPWLYEKLHAKEQAYKQSIRATTRMLGAVIGLFFLGIALFAQDYVVLFLEPSYVNAWKYVPMIVLVFAIKTMYYFYVEVLFYYKKASKLLFTATLSSSLLNIVLSYFMIPAWGVVGSVLADAVSMVLRVGIIVFISKRFDDVGLCVWDFIKNFLTIAAFIVAGLALSYIRYPNTFSLLNFGYKILVVLAYVAMLVLTYGKQLKPLMSKVLKKIKK